MGMGVGLGLVGRDFLFTWYVQVHEYDCKSTVLLISKCGKCFCQCAFVFGTVLLMCQKDAL